MRDHDRDRRPAVPQDGVRSPRSDGAPVAGIATPDWYRGLLHRMSDLRLSRLGLLRPAPGAVPRQSAVLVLFGAGADGPDVLLTQRSPGLRSHAGQVAFPGGRIDPEDGGPEAAALREGQEETGLDPRGVDVGGLAPRLYVPVTNYHVTPVIAWWRAPSPVGPVDTREVVRVVRVPLAELVNPENRFRVYHPSGLIGPGFSVRELFVWGFTAGVLDVLLTLAGWERPWDAARMVPVPAQPTADEVIAAQAVPDAVPDAGDAERQETA